MKALTVQQPWAWAIIYGGKDIENRTQAWSHRGPLAIHAGQRWSERGERSSLVANAYFDAHLERGWQVLDRQREVERATRHGLGRFLKDEAFSALIGVVDLVDVHLARMLDDESGCCDPWGEQSYLEHGGRRRRDVVHLVLENPRPLARPIPCRGALGLWTPPADVLEQLREVA